MAQRNNLSFMVKIPLRYGNVELRFDTTSTNSYSVSLQKNGIQYLLIINAPNGGNLIS